MIYVFLVTPLKYELGKTYKYNYKTAVSIDAPTSLKTGGGAKPVGLRLQLTVELSPVWQGAEEQLVQIIVR